MYSNFFLAVAPGTPTTLSFEQTSANNVTVRWLAGGGDNATFYTARAYNSSDYNGTAVNGQIDGVNTSASFTGLTVSAIYYFRVTAGNDGGVSGNLDGDFEMQGWWELELLL